MSFGDNVPHILVVWFGGARERDSRGTLLHALAKLPGHEDKLVGKAGPYLQGALVPHDGAEVFAAEYEILSVRL